MKDEIKIKVRGYHIDSYGHVNNTKYLEFVEEARWVIKDRYLHFFDKNHEEYGLVVVNNTIDYFAPAFLGDTLSIKSCILKIGNKSVLFQHEINNADTNQKVALAKATFVFFDRAKNLSAQIPKELIKNFNILIDNKK